MRGSGIVLVAAIATVVSGCAVGPKYKRPKVDVPSEFRGAHASADTNSLADLPWWSVFGDTNLQNLLGVALNQYLAFVQLYRALGGGFGDVRGNQ